MVDGAIGFAVGIAFTVFLLIPAIGFSVMQLRKYKRNRKRRRVAKSHTTRIVGRVENSAGISERDNPGESPSISSVGDSRNSPSRQASSETSRGTHASDRRGTGR